MEKIKNLQKSLSRLNLDGYIIPKNDEFFSSDIEPNEDRLRFISNFTGSYGLALILKKKNYLFVDGRYTVQANIQSSKSFKIETIPNSSPSKILKNKKYKIGFDPKLHTELMLLNFFKKTKCKLIPLNTNLIDKIWKNKKKNKVKSFFLLKKKVVGQSYKTKTLKVSTKIKNNKMDLQFVTAPENVAWLLNIRGNDYKFSPIPKSYLFIDKKNQLNFFCDLRKISNKIKKMLKKVNFMDIDHIENFFIKTKNKKIQIDKNTCSVLFKNILKKNNKIFEMPDPIYALKSLKNKKEIKNITESHIYDGAALTKFLFWLKNTFKRKKITELSAQNKLLNFRKNNKTFVSLSFPTISGTGPNGAIIHYKADIRSNRVLKRGDIYLVDSGGQYNYGTTDVTRTISLENNNKRIRKIFTRVLKGHISVSSYKIKKNTCGAEIDLVARKFLKQVKLDYAHGTGHGVGYFSNVHEGPQGISRKNKVKLREGMVISNEPGYYEKGKFGIRIENLIRVKKNNSFYKFVDLTMAPIDKSLIEKNLLSKTEINWLNIYHAKVFKNLKKFMNKKEIIDLKKSCSNI
ncbi:MAG: Xaa-Pro aminopeptidase [Pelagibacteraceae bacterium TMED287]|nr:MAG: Xaa-Pro aminopeptidase [Pelagibacteraceae bacterium TMED287]